MSNPTPMELAAMYSKDPKNPRNKSTVTSKFSVSDLGRFNVAQSEANDKYKYSQWLKEELNETKPPLTPGVSGYTTAGYNESAMFGCPAGMEPGVHSEYAFVSNAGPIFENMFNVEVPSKYELVDLAGRRLFFAAETLEALNEYPSKDRLIDILLIGRNGGNVLTVSGCEKKGYVVKNERNNHGLIEKNHRGEWHLKNSHGLVLLRVTKAKMTVKKGEKPEFNFKVEDFTSHAIMGLIKSTWNKTDNSDEDRTRVHYPATYGVQYDKKTSPLCKTLLISLLLILTHNHSHPIKFGSNKKEYWVGCCFIASVAFAIGIMLLVIIISYIHGGKHMDDNSRMTTTDHTESVKSDYKTELDRETTFSSKPNLTTSTIKSLVGK